MTRPAELLQLGRLQHRRLHGRLHTPSGALAALALGVLLALVAGLAPASALAGASLTWSPATSLPAGSAPTAVSCASESTCVAVEHQGDAFDTSDPTAETPLWTAATIDPGQSLNAVSCAPGGPCVAVDSRGDALVGRVAGAVSWSPPSSTHGGVLTGVSCPTASLCVAVDEEGDVLSSTEPESGAWKLERSYPGDRLLAVSCSSAALCVAVDSAGEALSSTEPDSARWSAQKVDSSELLAISCWASGACVATDAAGDALAGADPGAAHPTWSLTPLGGERPAGVSCAATGLCVLVNGNGEAFASGDSTSSAPEWTASGADPGESLSAVACLPGGFCVAVDTAGHSVGGRVPPPTATTLAPPSEVASSSALLTGIVDPNDGTLTACTFEYGTGATGMPYEASVPCVQTPTAGGENQSVSAAVSGLSPNTAYHYRIVASNLSGTTAGADATFTTPVSSQIAIVHPNPSIAGTPAVGQKLTCNAGTPTGSSAKLSYAWVRDQIPIAGATGSTYTVKGQDSGHHLQCQVTATDGGGSGSALSGFVTIPVGGVPASAGETSVGRATFKHGKVSVPIACSTLARGGCEVTLKVTAVETLSGARILAVTARAARGPRARIAASRHVSVTLAGVHARLARGAHLTLTAALSASARRLLASRRRFTAYATVHGTVVGVIEAQLARQLLTLRAPAHGASSPSNPARKASKRDPRRR
ncbi:MAG: hypothetical protein ACRDJX_08695 [Solirubrobacteraceae bacterium]